MNPILVGPLTVAGISTVIALIIAVLDKFLNNYGEVEISINGGEKKLQVKGGSPLLGTLAAENIFVPSACGGRGTCGACKCKIVSDVGPHLPTETPFMSQKESRAISTCLSGQGAQESRDRTAARALSIKNTNPRGKNPDVTHDIKEVLFSLDDGKSNCLRTICAARRPPTAKSRRACSAPIRCHRCPPKENCRAPHPPCSRRHRDDLCPQVPERGPSDRTRGTFRRIPRARHSRGDDLRGGRLGHGPLQEHLPQSS